MPTDDRVSRLNRAKQTHQAWIDQGAIVANLAQPKFDKDALAVIVASALRRAYELGAAGAPPPEPVDWRAFFVDRYVTNPWEPNHELQRLLAPRPSTSVVGGRLRRLRNRT